MTAPPTTFADYATLGVPPDGGGKKLILGSHVLLNYEGASEEFSKNTSIRGLTTGARGFIVDVLQTSTSVSGTIIIIYEEDTPLAGGNAISFLPGETIAIDDGGLTPNGTISADGVRIEYTPGYTLVGANNPRNRQFVDDRGAGYIRYTEGEQQLDSFGLSRHTSPTQLAQYFFSFDLIPEDIQTYVVNNSGNAAALHVPQESSARLVVGTSPGDEVTLTSHKYHPYQAGFGQLTEMTVVCGDTGKENLVRRWGYFDNEDGVYFEESNGVIYCCLRSSSDGSPNVDVRVPQTDWNVDKVDGSEGQLNLSKMELDVTSLNIYWLDIQWLGAGRVRFGVYDEQGTRITVHTLKNANVNTRPYMRTGKLPVRLQIINTGATASGSEIKVTCIAVKTEGVVLDTRQRRTRKFSGGMTTRKIVPSTGAETTLLSFRSATTIGDNSVTNRLLSVPEILARYVTGNPIELHLYKDAEILSGSFTRPNVDTAVELDEAGTRTPNTGRLMATWLLPVGAVSEQFPPNFGLFGESMFLKADGTTGTTYTFTAINLETNVDAAALLKVTWIDLQ